MSPEQARGKPVDKRTDVWAFGCVLYEMLAGRRAFEGETVSDTLAAILRGEPDWSALPERTPGKIRDLLRRCLKRDPKQRLHDIADARLEIEEVSAAGTSASASAHSPFEETTAVRNPTGGQSAPAVSARGRKKFLAVFLPWAVAAACAAAAGALALRARVPRHDGAVLQFELRPPDGTSVGNSLALSPDGRRVAFVATDEKGVDRLTVRSFETLAPLAFAGTDGARFPFWSPDGKSIAFFMGDRLVRVSASGGPPQTICTAPDGRGGSWSPRDVIIYTPGTRMPLYRVTASGGVPAPLTSLRPRDYTHRWPKFLPDGVHFLYLCMSNDDTRGGIHTGSLDSPEDSFVVATRGRADYDAGRLLFVRESTLFSQPFDADRRKLSGEPAPIADGIIPEGESGWTGLAPFSGAADGTLVFRRRASLRQKLTWFDRGGKALGVLGEPASMAEPFWFPGAKSLGITVSDPRTDVPDLWQIDLGRGTWTRLTFGPKSNNSGGVSPDGKSLYFSSTGEGSLALRRRSLDGSAADDLILSPRTDAYVDFVSPDGAWVVFESSNSGRNELWRLPLAGERKPVLLLAGPQSSVAHASPSPDGSFFAYASDETGRSEVYLQRFPPSGGKWQISKDGGDQPLWRADGKELFFLAPDRKLMAVDLSLKGDVEAGSPKALFAVHVTPNGIGDNRSQYLPAPDGSRFLVIVASDERQDQPAVVVLNWPAMGGSAR